MPQISFGNILREARERRGYDLTETARRLRIRPDILLAIEEEDFSRMPPHGYTRNMVNAYARLVGLNPTEITKMFLDANYAYRAGKVRSGSPRSTGRTDFVTGPTRGSGRARAGRGEADGGRPARANAFGRMVYDDRREYGRDYGQRNMERIHAQDSTHQSRRPALNTQYTNFYAGPSNAGFSGSRLPILIAIAVVLLLLVIVLSFTMCNRDSGTDAPKVPVSGMTDTTGTDEPAGADQGGAYNSPVTETAPTSVTVVYEVAAGSDYPAGIYASINGEAEMVKGPVEKDVDVTDTWTFATWATDQVTITCNGEPVEFNGTDEASMPMATVKFSTYLDKWYEDHPNVKRPGASGGSDAAASGDDGAGAGDGDGSGDGQA